MKVIIYSCLGTAADLQQGTEIAGRGKTTDTGGARSQQPTSRGSNRSTEIVPPRTRSTRAVGGDNTSVVVWTGDSRPKNREKKR